MTARTRPEPALDVILAFVGVASAALVTSWFALTKSYFLYPFMSSFALIACLGYLGIRWKAGHIALPAVSVREQPRVASAVLLLNTLFFASIGLAIAVIAFRPEIYSRPLPHFIFMAVAAGTLAVEAVSLPDRKPYHLMTLSKIALLTMVLIWAPQVVFPGLLGIDPFFHADLTNTVVNTGHLPPENLYTPFPMFHLTSAASMLITGLTYKTATMISITFLYVITAILFAYLLGKLLYNPKIGLLAALLLGTATLFIRFGWSTVPNSYAAVLLPVIAYLIFARKTRGPVRLSCLMVLLFIALILMHSLTALSMAMLLFLFWSGSAIYKRFFRERSPSPVSFWLPVLFTVMMFTWWMYRSPNVIGYIRFFLEEGLTEGLLYRPIEQSFEYSLSIPLGENLLANFAYVVYWPIALVGCLGAFSRRTGNRNMFLLCVVGLAFMVLGLIGLTLSLDIVPERWQILSVFMLAVPAALGLILILGTVKSMQLRIAAVFALVTLMSFLSFISPFANVENTKLTENTAVRYAFTDSETEAARSIAARYEGEAVLDAYYGRIYPGLFDTGKMVGSLLDKDFGISHSNAVLIRKEIVERPFFLVGRYRLDYDPRELLGAESFSRFYDCGTVDAFLDTRG